MAKAKIKPPLEVEVHTIESLRVLADQDKLIGEFLNIPDDVYHRGPGVSRSDLASLMSSPEHWEQRIKDAANEVPTPSLIFGKALHSYILEPELFKQGYQRYPEHINMRTNAGKQEMVELIAQFSKAEFLSVNIFDSVIKMGDKFKQHKVCAEFLDGSKKEVTYYWKDKETGILCKARLDIVHPKLGVMDVKSTSESALRQSFMRACVKYNYDLQAGHYWKGAAVTLGKDLPFHFGVIEKAEPHGIVVHKADFGLIECGLDIQAYLLQKLDDFLNARIPFSYPEKIVTLGLPVWGMDLDSRLEKEWL